MDFSLAFCEDSIGACQEKFEVEGLLKESEFSEINLKLRRENSLKDQKIQELHQKLAEKTEENQSLISEFRTNFSFFNRTLTENRDLIIDAYEKILRSKNDLWLKKYDFLGRPKQQKDMSTSPVKISVCDQNISPIPQICNDTSTSPIYFPSNTQVFPILNRCFPTQIPKKPQVPKSKPMQKAEIFSPISHRTRKIGKGSQLN